MWPSAVFPARCGRPAVGWEELRGLLPEDCGHMLVLGRACLGALVERLPAISAGAQVVPQEQCFHLVADPALVNQAIADGGYLVTPGWLADWRSRLTEMGFEADRRRILQGLCQPSWSCSIRASGCGIRRAARRMLSERSDYRQRAFRLASTMCAFCSRAWSMNCAWKTGARLHRDDRQGATGANWPTTSRPWISWRDSPERDRSRRRSPPSRTCSACCSHRRRGSTCAWSTSSPRSLPTCPPS